MDLPVGDLHGLLEAKRKSLRCKLLLGAPGLHHLVIDGFGRHLACELAGGRATHAVRHDEQGAALPHVMRPNGRLERGFAAREIGHQEPVFVVVASPPEVGLAEDLDPDRFGGAAEHGQRRHWSRSLRYDSRRESSTAAVRTHSHPLARSFAWKKALATTNAAYALSFAARPGALKMWCAESSTMRAVLGSSVSTSLLRRARAAATSITGLYELGDRVGARCGCGGGAGAGTRDEMVSRAGAGREGPAGGGLTAAGTTVSARVPPSTFFPSRSASAAPVAPRTTRTTATIGRRARRFGRCASGRTTGLRRRSRSVGASASGRVGGRDGVRPPRGAPSTAATSSANLAAD